MAQERIDSVSFGEVEVDFVRRRCRRKGREIELTTKEFGSLELLVSRSGDPVSRDDILDLVWGYGAFPTTRTVDNHIARLRSKLEVDPSQPKQFLTVPKIGYRFQG